MDYLIRETRLEDGKDIWIAQQRAIKEVCSKDYTPEQITAWSNFDYNPERFKNALDSDDYNYVLVVNEKVEGFFHFKLHNDFIEISHLYFSPDMMGKGMGRKIFQKAFDVAREKGIKKMKLHSTKTSRGFYEKMGFKVITDDCCQLGGVEIPGFTMEMNL